MMELKKLDEVLKVVRGSSPRPIKSYITESEEGVNWIKIGDANENDKYITSTKEKITKLGAGKSRFVDVGDFIFSNSMSFGRAYIMKISGYIHDGWFTFKLPQTLDQNYLWYLFRSPFLKDQINTLASGAIVQNISSDLVKKCILPIPPLSEQQAIVKKLDAAFALIDQAKANIEKNIQNAKELFQSKLNQIFSQKGEGWEERKLGEVSKINYGCTEKAIYEDKGYKYLRITDLTDKGVNWETVPNCELNPSELHKYLLEEGDIVFARTGATTGKSYMFSDNVTSVFASYLIRLKILNKEILLPNFVNLFFQSGIYWEEISKGISGSAQGGFNASKLSELKFSFPKSLETQQQIVLQLDALSEQTKQLEAKYKTKLGNLEELRKSILEKAFKGELVQMSESQISTD